MILHLPLLVYGVALILAANYELRAKHSRPLTALLSFGLTEIGIVWTAAQKLIARLNPLDKPRFDARNPLHRVVALLLLAQLALVVGQLLSAGGAPGTRFFSSDAGAALSVWRHQP